MENGKFYLNTFRYAERRNFMNPENYDNDNIVTGGEFRRVSTKIKPIIKRVAKSAAVVCVSLTVGSLGAAAKENLNKANTVTKVAKSAKSSSKKAKRAVEIGSALIVCANAGSGAVEEVVSNDGSKVFKIILFGVIWFCGLMCGKEICE